MKEGLVLEVYKSYVVVMSNSGEFLKLKKTGTVNVGDVYKGKPYIKFSYSYAAAAAIMLIIISTYTGITAYANQIVGFVDINGNKNVRLYINRKGTVQKVDGLKNSNGLKNLTPDKAAEKLGGIGAKEGVFTENSKPVVSSTKLKDSDVNISNIEDKVEKAINAKVPEKEQSPSGDIKDKENKDKDKNNNNNNEKATSGNKDNIKGNKENTLEKQKYNPQSNTRGNGKNKNHEQSSGNKKQNK